MNPNDTTALCDAKRDGRRRGTRSFVDLQVEVRAEEGLVGCGEKQGCTKSRQYRGVAEQLQRLSGRLAQIQAGVEDHLVEPEPGRPGPAAPLEQELGHG